MEKILIDKNEVVFDFKLDNGIVIGVFQSDYLDLAISKKVTEYRLEFQKHQKYPLLSNIKGVKNITKDARDFMASVEGCEGVVVAAIVMESPITSMIGNFFLRVSRPIVPTKLFTDTEEAKSWLQQYVNL